MGLICSDCSSRVTNCPSCRVKFETPKIRNRLAEKILDRMVFDCEHKEYGCGIKLKRAEKIKHEESCSFAGTKINLCDLFGLTCNFVARTIDADRIKDHFMKEHSARFVTQEHLAARNFVRLSYPPPIRPDATLMFCRILVIFQNPWEDGSIFLLQISYSQRRNCFLFACIEISDDTSKYTGSKLRTMKFLVPATHLQFPDLPWNVSIFQATYAAFAIKHMQYSIPADAFKPYADGGYIHMRCAFDQYDGGLHQGK